MHAHFTLHEAKGIFTDDHERDALDAGFITRQVVKQLDLEVMALAPARVHAIEHLRPVLRFGTAGASVQREDGVALVVFTRKQRLQTHLLEIVLELFQVFADFSRDFGVISLFAEVN